MLELWARGMLKNRIHTQVTVPLDDDVREAVAKACREFDISKPIWLSKHEREWNTYGRTSFAADHFMDKLPFDKLEIERVDLSKPPTKSTDPRSMA